MTVEYAQIVSTLDQRPDSTEPVPIFMDQNDQISGIEHTIEHPADIRITDSGVYTIIASPQVGTKSSNGKGNIDFWLRKNGHDIPNSTVRCTIRNGDEKDVIVNQAMLAFNAGDVINVMMAVDKAGEGLGIEAIRTPGRPLIPSIIFSMHKIKDAAGGHWVTTQKGTKKVWVE